MLYLPVSRIFRIIVYSFILITVPHILSAQDTLFRRSGHPLVGKIIEVNPSQVKMNLSQNMGGPVYVIDRQEVARIKYSNGSYEEFSIEYHKAEKQQKHTQTDTVFNKNFISINLPSLFFNSINIAYERTFKTGYFSLKVPVAVGIKKEKNGNYYNDFDYKRNRVFSVGLEFYGYPAGQGKIKYFIGPSLEYGQLRYNIYNWSYSSLTYSDPILEEKKTNYFEFLVQNGVLFQPAKYFNLSFNIGVGGMDIKYLSPPYPYLDDLRVVIRGGFNLGYKF